MATILGTSASDELVGGYAGDWIDGREGDDTLHGGLGEDTLLGGDGTDLIMDSSGRDKIKGGAGDDYISHYAEDYRGRPFLEGDTFDGGDGFDSLRLNGIYRDTRPFYLDASGAGGHAPSGAITAKLISIEQISIAAGLQSDTLIGAVGDDFLSGSGGDDSLVGGDGDDSIAGEPGDDTLRGGAGNDTLSGGYGVSDVSGDAGDDKIDVELARSIPSLGHTIDGGEGVDKLTLTVRDDDFRALNIDLSDPTTTNILPDGTTIRNIEALWINGTQRDDSIVGGSGTDELYGYYGNDTLNAGGGAGQDSLYGFVGDDVLRAGAGRDFLLGGSGNDTLYASRADGDLLLGDAGGDLLVGGSGADRLNGGTGRDKVEAGDGDDRVIVLVSGGTDTIDGGDGVDLLQIFRRGSTSFDVSLGQSDGQIVLADGTELSSIERVKFVSGRGDDTLEGGIHADTLNGVGGDDSLLGSAGHDLVKGGDGADTLSGDDGDDKLEGGAGGDLLKGGDGDDQMFGDLGDDTLEGGDGDDIYIVDSLRDVITERSGGGDDEITAYVNFHLEAGIEVETLRSFDAVALAGNEFDQKLFGSAGRNKLDGGGGGDTLIGGGGSDTLQGGSGDDVFQSRHSADDITIADFTLGEDKFMFFKRGLTEFEELSHYMKQSGNDVVIDYAFSFVRIENIDIDDLTANDFLFA
jgi:Ca2+-binding RTX toxin-like protein